MTWRARRLHVITYLRCSQDHMKTSSQRTPYIFFPSCSRITGRPKTFLWDKKIGSWSFWVVIQARWTPTRVIVRTFFFTTLWPEHRDNGMCHAHVIRYTRSHATCVWAYNKRVKEARTPSFDDPVVKCCWTHDPCVKQGRLLNSIVD